MIMSCTHCPASMLIQDKQVHHHHHHHHHGLLIKGQWDFIACIFRWLLKPWTYVNIIMNRSHMSEIASRTGTWLSIFSFCGPVAFVDRTKNGDTSIKLKGYLEQEASWLYLCALFAFSFFFSLSFSLSKTPLFFITLILFPPSPFILLGLRGSLFSLFYYLHSYSYSPIPLRLCTISTLSFINSRQPRLVAVIY